VTSTDLTARRAPDRHDGDVRTPSDRIFLGGAAGGLAGMILVVLGACEARSPFTSDIRGSWPIALVRGPFDDRWVGLLLVYSGIVLLLGAWYCVVMGSERPLRQLSVVLAAWVAPLLAVPPLFSRDAYAYAALGQVADRGINPYHHSPAALQNPSFLRFVDPLWRHAHAPYGPLFMDIGRADASLAGHSILVSVEGYRLAALLGVLLVAVSVPTIARSVGRPESKAFALAVLNPLVLLYLVGGAHNDALMLGLLVSGVAVAVARHPVAGVVLCALAAEVKIPGLIGVVYIGWVWAGQGAGVSRRLRFVALSVVVAGVTMAVISEVSGLGWGWLSNLSDPGTVITWLDPATALGLATSHVLHAVGISGSVHPVVVTCRAIALALAGVITVTMLVRTERYGLPKALALSLLAVVFLGPIVWPWYETWGVVFLACVAERWAGRVVILLTTIGCFATTPAHVSLSPGHVWALTGVLAVLVIAVTAGVAFARRASHASLPAPAASAA
jgi:alpha-1,6-mannosyltransferase